MSIPSALRQWQKQHQEQGEASLHAIAQRAAAPIFALAMFSGAALLFVLQPLFAHMATPLLGGSPAVWNVSMAFFQAALLVGYLYAHLLARLPDLRAQALIHAAVLGLAFLALPVHITSAFGAPSSTHPELWLVGVLALSVGAPFAAISATAPLLQSWYARSGRADAHDPYYLYAASNLGSFLGLLAYPVVVEPLLGIRAQGASWAVGYVIVAAMILAAGAITLGAHVPAETTQTPRSPAPSTRQRLYWLTAAAAPSALILGVTLHISTDVASAPLLWVVPLALYLATFVIAFMRGSEKLTPIVEFVFPFAIAALLACYFSRANWPLALAGNLGGFFISALLCHLALARSRPSADRLTEFYFYVSLGGVIGGAFAAFVAPLIFNDVYEYPIALAVAALFLSRGHAWMPRIMDGAATAAVFLTIVIVTAVLTGRETRDIVLAASLVGAAGALVAGGWGGESSVPVFRYALMLAGVVIAALVIAVWTNQALLMPSSTQNGFHFRFAPGFDLAIGATAFLTLLFAAHASVQPRQDGARLADLGVGIAIPAAMLLLALDLQDERFSLDAITAFTLAFVLIALIFNRMRPILCAALILCGFATVALNDVRGAHTMTQVRSFFGVLRTRVLKDPANPRIPELRILMHGTTIHGAQLHAPGLSRLPLTYYNPNTSLGEAILAGLNTGEHSSLALIGLGTGTTACLTRPTDSMTIFEIDPAVVRLSTTPQGDFTYVPECQPHAQVRLGDARLQIAKERDGAFDVIVVDAFSSDAIPAHLLTREAIALYLRKTSDRGIVVLHLSNRNLALVSEAARVAHSLGAATLLRESARVNETYAPFYGGLPASTMIVAKSPQILARLPLASRDWSVLRAPPGRPWSDDYINIARALWEALDGDEQCRVTPGEPQCAGRKP